MDEIDVDLLGYFSILFVFTILLLIVLIIINLELITTILTIGIVLYIFNKVGIFKSLDEVF